MTKHRREQTNQDDELTTDELEHISGGKPTAPPKDPPANYLTYNFQTATISGYSL